jgi:uncharacterized protein
LLLCWAFAAFADVTVPPLVGRVVDQTATLSGSEIDALQQTIRSFEQSKGSQIAVLIVPTTSPETIEQYSIRVAEAWKIGRKKFDDGVLLVVAKDDRKLRIEVGYGLEGALTDVTSKRIIDEVITPNFKRGDFAGGIAQGVSSMMRIIEGEKLPPPPPRQQQSSDWVNHIDPGIMIFGAIFMGGILRALLGRLIGAAATGGIVGVLAWLVAGSLAASFFAAGIVFLIALVVDLSSARGSSSGGGWSGGSSSGGGGGWSSSSGSSDSGGFSGGGGGSFGGGGASGSW